MDLVFLLLWIVRVGLLFVAVGSIYVYAPVHLIIILSMFIFSVLYMDEALTWFELEPLSVGFAHILIILSFFLHELGGVFDIYEKHPNYDVITHTVTSASITILALFYLFDDPLTVTAFISALTIIIAFNLFWEGFEYAFTKWTSDVVWHGMADLRKDTVVNIVGMLIGYAITILIYRKTIPLT